MSFRKQFQPTIAAFLLTCVSLCACSEAHSDPGAPGPPASYLRFDGVSGYAEVPSAPELGVSARGLTIAVWMRPDALTFTKTQGGLASEQYVHWLEKGQKDQYEWTFRMYSLTNPGPRQNRISFYVFAPQGGLGCGSYFQDPIEAGKWIQVVGVANQATQETSIYKNGALRHSDSYATLTLAPGSAPVRIGSGDLSSFLQGAVGPIEIWNRPLSSAEIRTLYKNGHIPAAGLVARYALDEGSGSLLHDTAGHHDARLVAGTWGNAVGPVETAMGHSGGGC